MIRALTSDAAPLAGRKVGRARAPRQAAAPISEVVRVPVAPPAAWFTDPHLARPTALEVEEDGRVYGHAWLWGTCHTGYPGECRTAPRGYGYRYYMLGAVRTEDGGQVAVGRITLGTIHAPLEMGWSAASRHYGDSGCAVCDVAFGDDRHGGWFAGALRPGVTEAQVRELRASPLSGDWRPIDGRLELVAMLAVNSPGFPVPRIGLAADGSVHAVTGLGGPVTSERLIERAVADLEVAALCATLA